MLSLASGLLFSRLGLKDQLDDVVLKSRVSHPAFLRTEDINYLHRNVVYFQIFLGKTIVYLSGTDRSWYHQSLPSICEHAKRGFGGWFTRDILSELKAIKIKHGTAEMQCLATFEEFYNLLTETHNQHKRKPAELEKELREVIKKGKEMLQGLQRQDRFV